MGFSFLSSPEIAERKIKLLFLRTQLETDFLALPQHHYMNQQTYLPSLAQATVVFLWFLEQGSGSRCDHQHTKRWLYNQFKVVVEGNLYRIVAKCCPYKDTSQEPCEQSQYEEEIDCHNGRYGTLDASGDGHALQCPVARLFRFIISLVLPLYDLLPVPAS